MNVLKLSKKYPQISRDEMMNIISGFNGIDSDGQGLVPKAKIIAELSSPSSTLGQFSYDQVRETLRHVSLDSSGSVDLDDFVEVVVKLKGGTSGDATDLVRGTSGLSLGGVKQAQPRDSVSNKASAFGRQQASSGTTGARVVVTGSSSSTAHTINEDERSEFTNHINSTLADDPDIKDRLPIPNDTMQVFDECRDGLILAKLVNDAVADTIDERVLNRGKNGKPMNQFQMTENNNLVISSSKALGFSTVNIGAEDIAEGREHLILGLIWQLIRKALLAKIDIKIHPELYRLLEDGETLDQLLRLRPDQILLRWINYHLKAANWPARVSNFSKDLADATAYTVLLNQITVQQCSLAPLKEPDVLTRAELVLQNADDIGCRKFLTARAMVAGNDRLNLAFVANLFNNFPALDALEPETIQIEDFDAEGEREARVFTLWLNSLNVDPGVYALFEDLKDGTILLQAFDKVIPQSVLWRRVTKATPGVEMSRFKQVENTNYAVDLAQKNHLHIVGIQGADITDGNRTLTLGLVWQLMRLSVLDTLAKLSTSTGKAITEQDVVAWANSKVKASGKTSTMRSFKDESIRNARFFLDLLNALKPGYVDYSLVYQGATDEECKANAKLAISIARKLGSLIFIVAEDIVDVRPRLVFTFVAALMALGL